MASQGPLSPSVGDNNASVGTFVWGGTGSIFTSNDVRAFATDVGGGSSNYLTAQGFGFSIPVGSSVDGIVVEIERSSNIDSGSDYIVDNVLKLIKSDGTIAGADKADRSTHWPTSDAYVSYGGSTDTWGLAWSNADINSANFGVALSVEVDAGGDATARVDHIRITVYYTENATTTSTSSSTSSTSTSYSSTSASTSSTSSSISSTSSSTSMSSSTSSSTSFTYMSINVTPIGFIKKRW